MFVMEQEDINEYYVTTTTVVPRWAYRYVLIEARIKLGLGYNCKTMINALSWSHDNQIIKTFHYRESDIVINTAVIIKFMVQNIPFFY